MLDSLRFSIVSDGAAPWFKDSMKAHSLSMVPLAHWMSVSSIKEVSTMVGTSVPALIRAAIKTNPMIAMPARVAPPFLSKDFFFLEPGLPAPGLYKEGLRSRARISSTIMRIL